MIQRVENDLCQLIVENFCNLLCELHTYQALNLLLQVKIDR